MFRLTGICRIKRWFVHFLFKIRNIFSDLILLKKSITCLSWNLEPSLIQICRIRLCSFFFRLETQAFFAQIWSKTLKHQIWSIKKRKFRTLTNSYMQTLKTMYGFLENPLAMQSLLLKKNAEITCWQSIGISCYLGNLSVV